MAIDATCATASGIRTTVAGATFSVQFTSPPDSGLVVVTNYGSTRLSVLPGAKGDTDETAVTVDGANTYQVPPGNLSTVIPVPQGISGLIVNVESTAAVEFSAYIA